MAALVMLQRLLFPFVLAMTCLGCGYEYGESYRAVKLADELRTRLSQEKRDFIKIEELQIGDGPLAAWNRRVTADLEVKYTDGTVVYSGPAFSLIGFYAFPDAGIWDELHLGSRQEGIRLGLNGMAVGGKRRFTVNSAKVCAEVREVRNFETGCLLVGRSSGIHGTGVKKRDLIVEATLTESCVPKVFTGFIWSANDPVPTKLTPRFAVLLSRKVEGVPSGSARKS